MPSQLLTEGALLHADGVVSVLLAPIHDPLQRSSEAVGRGLASQRPLHGRLLLSFPFPKASLGAPRDQIALASSAARIEPTSVRQPSPSTSEPTSSSRRWGACRGRRQPQCRRPHHRSRQEPLSGMGPAGLTPRGYERVSRVWGLDWPTPLRVQPGATTSESRMAPSSRGRALRRGARAWRLPSDRSPTRRRTRRRGTLPTPRSPRAAFVGGSSGFSRSSA